MDLLKQELQRKRKAIELAKKSDDVGRIGNAAISNDEKCTKRTYFKAADFRRFQERREEEEDEKKRRDLTKPDRKGRNNHIDAKKRQRLESNVGGCNEKVKRGDTKGSSRHSNSTHDGQLSGSANEKINKSESKQDEGRNSTLEKTMSSKDITEALRELGIPVRLFGERSDIKRLERLGEARESRKAAMAGLSEMNEYRLGSGHGIRNPFLGKNKDEGLDSKSKPRHDKDDTSSKIYGDIDQSKEGGDNDNDPHKTIHGFFKVLLHQWEEDLANRPDSVKRTATGKNETKTLKQCKDYIRPLFKLCKNRTLEESIMGSILKIVNCCKEGEFVKANDAYMDVAIGRAAWPIGVTMVGIHQRSGRERINAEKVAHVMNSELQRKYLTSVKRLITYCQKKRPDVDPSKKVINV
jgi:pre-mRNA-splicing factor 18